MAKETKVTLRTRHINCFYCIALSFLILAVLLFVLSSQQSQVLNNRQNRIPVVISATIILLLSIVIFIWITYYAIGYFRAKKHEQLNRLKKQKNVISTTAQTSVVIFDNAAFTMDDPLAIDSPTHMQASA